MSGLSHGALSLGPASYTARQFLFCYIRVVSQPILGLTSLFFPRDGILRRNKFAFQPTSLVLGRAAASVHLRPRKSCREKPRRSLPSRRRKSRGRRDTAKLFTRMIGGQSRLSRSLKSARDHVGSALKIGSSCRENFKSAEI